ncbi:MAG: hypothetical protein N2321_10845 [Melioribacteraceae bacterium]|nr:hypothetical protein [Melioribacteraceae bacterium]
MKKFYFLLLFTFISINSIIAQEEEDVGWVSRFGAAGGVSPTFIFTNLDMLNKEIKNFGLPEMSNNLFTFGGGGYVYLMIVENLRVGGIGFGGSKSVKGSVFLSGNKLNREVDYDFGFGGLTLEYSLPFIKGVAVSVGVIFGGGTQVISIYESKGNYNWNNVWPSNSNFASTVSNEIKNNFFSITPTLNIDLPLTRFVALRIGGGYILNFSDEWKLNNEQSLFNVPKDLTSNNYFIQTGIYFGFFAF